MGGRGVQGEDWEDRRGLQSRHKLKKYKNFLKGGKRQSGLCKFKTCLLLTTFLHLGPFSRNVLKPLKTLPQVIKHMCQWGTFYIEIITSPQTMLEPCLR